MPFREVCNHTTRLVAEDFELSLCTFYILRQIFFLKLLIAFKRKNVYQFIIKDNNLANMLYFHFNEMDIFLSWIRDLQSNNSCFQT